MQPVFRNRRRAPWPIALCIAFAACGGPAEFLRRPQQPISWPPGSTVARIELVMGYHGSEDVTRHPGFWASLFELVAGEEQVALVSPHGLALSDADTLWVADPGSGAVRDSPQP